MTTLRAARAFRHPVSAVFPTFVTRYRQKKEEKNIFLRKYFAVSKKSCNFAP